jgi:hypothetical protein
VKTYQEFLHFASKRLKLSFEIVEIIVWRFLQKYYLRPRTIECYLLWNDGRKTHAEVGKLLKIGSSTVTRELQKLEFICPELFIRGFYVPEIPWMYHPTKEEWEELERMGLIKGKF